MCHVPTVDIFSTSHSALLLFDEGVNSRNDMESVFCLCGQQLVTMPRLYLLQLFYGDIKKFPSQHSVSSGVSSGLMHEEHLTYYVSRKHKPPQMVLFKQLYSKLHSSDEHWHTLEGASCCYWLSLGSNHVPGPDGTKGVGSITRCFSDPLPQCGALILLFQACAWL